MKSASLLLFAILLATPSTHATSFTVTTLADDSFDNGTLDSESLDGTGLSLREAIGLANQNNGAPQSGDPDGDRIRFAPLVAIPGAQDYVVGSELLITDDVVIDGTSGPTGVAVIGSGGDRVFHIDTIAAPGSIPVEFLGLAIRRGSINGQGGGIYAARATEVILNGCEVNNNRAFAGAGVFSGGVLQMTECDISENTAVSPLGSTDGIGGGVFMAAGAQLEATDSVFTQNVASGAGGAIADASGPDTITVLSNVELAQNFAGSTISILPAPAVTTGDGGALHVSENSSLRVIGGSMTGNHATHGGGALWNEDGSIRISDATISENTAEGAAADDGGGGIFNSAGEIQLNGVTISQNQATGIEGSGGGILNTDGAVIISGGGIHSNTANRAGGGIEAINGVIEITGSLLTENTAGPDATATPGNGGAVNLSGAATLILTDSTAENNIAKNQGGGLWNSSTGTMELHGSTLSNNGTKGGGGIFTETGDGEVTLSNCTLSGNEATNGGGMLISGGKVSLSSVTIATNMATDTGGGIEKIGGSLSTLNTLITDNVAADAPDLSGAADDSSHSLLGNSTGSTGITNGVDGNITDVDPLLQALADNGGPTKTHLMDPMSAAVNAGSTVPVSSLSYDQRGSGFPRIINVTIDIGAVEIAILTYDLWADLTFSDTTSVADRDPNANPDCDQLSNALEWLFGTDPEQANPSPLQVTATASEVNLSYPVQNGLPAGVDFIEVSSDCVVWTPATNATVTMIPGAPHQITQSLPLNVPGREFARIGADTTP